MLDAPDCIEGSSALMIGISGDGVPLSNTNTKSSDDCGSSNNDRGKAPMEHDGRRLLWRCGHRKGGGHGHGRDNIGGRPTILSIRRLPNPLDGLLRAVGWAGHSRRRAMHRGSFPTRPGFSALPPQFPSTRLPVMYARVSAPPLLQQLSTSTLP